MGVKAPMGRPGPGSTEDRLLLADAVPDLLSSTTADERALLQQISVPVVHVPKGSIQLEELLGPHAAFAAVIIDGLMLHQLTIATEPGLRILGPGDLVVRATGAGPELLASSTLRVQCSTRLALLGNEFLTAVRHVPRVAAGLQAATAEQIERLSTQLVICQLPRVAERVLAMLWLLAESFGRVTPSGTVLSLSLTHEALGALVGARRPTVTLALGELARRGAVVPQDSGWLLRERLTSGGTAEQQIPQESAPAQPRSRGPSPNPLLPNDVRLQPSRGAPGMVAPAASAKVAPRGRSR